MQHGTSNAAHCEIEMILSCIAFWLDANVTDPLSLNLLIGMTQQSYLAAIDGQDVAHFSHPFSLDLFFDINRLDQVHGSFFQLLIEIDYFHFVSAVNAKILIKILGYTFMQ